MAEHDSRHAAWQSGYEVREGLESVPGLDLGTRHRCTDYLDAVEFALAFVDEHDPLREGLVSWLEIIKVDGDRRSTVWHYSASEAQRGHEDPTEVFGFDVTAPWYGPAGKVA
jgi:hypothetical protein